MIAITANLVAASINTANRMSSKHHALALPPSTRYTFGDLGMQQVAQSPMIRRLHCQATAFILVSNFRSGTPRQPAPNDPENSPRPIIPRDQQYIRPHLHADGVADGLSVYSQVFGSQARLHALPARHTTEMACFASRRMGFSEYPCPNCNTPESTRTRMTNHIPFGNTYGIRMVQPLR